MLHRIIEDDHIELLNVSFEQVHSADAVLAHGNRYIRESAVHLHRFIAYRIGGGHGIRQYETACLAFVSATEDRRMVSVGKQQLYQIRRHGSLTRPSYGDISHTDGGYIHMEGRQQMPVKEPVTYGYACSVQPA